MSLGALILRTARALAVLMRVLTRGRRAYMKPCDRRLRGADRKLHDCPDGNACRSSMPGGCARGWCAHFEVRPDAQGVPRYPGWLASLKRRRRGESGDVPAAGPLSSQPQSAQSGARSSANRFFQDLER